VFSQEYELNTETIYKAKEIKKRRRNFEQKLINCIKVIPEIILTLVGFGR
jgi:hypothetical protein